MKRWGYSLLALSGLWTAGPAQAQTTVLDFEGMDGCAHEAVTAGYGGFSWSNFFVVSSECDDVSAGVASGTNASFNGWGDLSLVRGGFFNFNSANFASWGTGIENGETGGPMFPGDPFAMTIAGYRNGTMVYSQMLNLTAETQLFQLNWLQIDKVAFIPNDDVQGWFLLDDMSTTVAPEPLSMLLLGSGLVGVAGVGRRRRRVTDALAEADADARDD